MIKINEKTRRVSPVGVVNVKSDLKAHRLHFICKDQVTENVKLSECSLWVNYKNGDTYDRYAVEDLTVDGDKVTFSWLLGGNATAYNGETQFTILAEQTENGEIVLAWNTALASFKVENAIEAEYTPRESQQDAFEQLLQMASGKQDKLTAGTGITIDNNVISATGGGGSVDFDDTITQDETTGKYGIDFATYSQGSYTSGKAIDGATYTLGLAGLAQAINGKQDTLGSGDITTSLLADGAVTYAKIDSTLLAALKSCNGAIVNVKDYGAKGDGVTDDLQACRDAYLYAAEHGGIVFFPKGTYALSGVLYVRSNQYFLGDNATLLPIGAAQSLIITYNESSATGYTGAKNITIDGFIFDGNSTRTDNFTPIGTSHADNITIKNCTFKNGRQWHYIEINSSNNTRVQNCIFEQYMNGYITASETESIQIDLAGGNGNRGQNDGTVCKNIYIESCIFITSGHTAIGNHTNAAHSNIRIYGNQFKGGSGIRGYINFVTNTYAVDIYDNVFGGSANTDKAVVLNNTTANAGLVHDNRGGTMITPLTGGTIYSNIIGGTFYAGALGGGGTAYTAGSGLSLNGTEFSVDTTTIATVSSLASYAPQSTTYTKAEVDTALSGKVGSASVTTIWSGTQAQYDAITTKDANTLYCIKEA